MPRRGGEVVEHVLLPGEIAGQVPGLSIFAATTDIGDDVDAVGVKPKAFTCAQKTGLLTRAVATIPLEKGRIGTVKPDPLLVKNVQRNTGAVLGNGELPNNLDI